MNFLQNLRLQTLYNPSFWNSPDGETPGASVSVPNQPPDMGPGNMPDSSDTMPQPMLRPQPAGGGLDSITQMMSQLYHPQTQNIDRLNQLIDNYPQSPEPGFMRKLSASLIGGLSAAGGNDPTMMQKDILHPGLDDALKEWNAKVRPTEAAANVERQANSNERTMAMQTIADKLRTEAQQSRDAYNQRKADTEDAKLVEKTKMDEANLDVRRKRADVYEFKARNPGMKLVTVKGGNIMAMDPISGTLKDTGIDSGVLSDADKLALQIQGQEELAGVKGDETRKTLGVRNTGMLDQILKRGEQARLTKATPSGNAAVNKPQTEMQKRIGQYTKAHEIYTTDPTLRQFIKLGPGPYDFDIVPPSTSMFGSRGPTQEQYKSLQDAIYGPGGTIGTMSPIKPIPSHEVPNAGGNSGNMSLIPGKGGASAPAPNKQTAPNANLRDRAITILTNGNRPLTEANIQEVIRQLGGQ